MGGEWELQLAVETASGHTNLLEPCGVFFAMNDDKRLLRELKREVKRAGNRKRRRYLKDVAAEPGDFNFGRKRSEVMNQPRNKDARKNG
jgi:hypothetical protein